MPRRHALIVGIDRYLYFPHLRGCVQDAEAMAGVLRHRFEFEPERTRVLRDEEATEKGILDALAVLAGKVGEDDQVVFYFSGHGSWIEAPLEVSSHEPDRRDQTLVPVDSGRNEHPTRDIRDDEIYEWLLRVSDVTPFITFIFDSCHAGTAVRDAFAAQEKWVQPWRRRVEDREGGRRRSESSGVLRGAVAGHPLADRYALLAACGHDQGACVFRDSNRLHHSVFTYFLVRELSRIAPGTTYRELLEVVRERVGAEFPDQTPYVEGARDREVFGVATFEPARFVEVLERDGEQVTLGGGAALGVTPVSEWKVYPPGTRRFRDPERPSGRIRIDQVRAVTSTGRVIEEDLGNPVCERGRATLIARDHLMQMTVEVPGEGDAVAELRAEIEDSPVLRLSDHRDGAARVCVYEVAPRTGAESSVPVPQIGEVRDPVWALVGRDGRLLVKPCAVHRSGSIQRVVRNLETYAGFQHVVSLRDSEDPNPLQGCLTVTLLRAGPDGSWCPAAVGAVDDVVEYAEGECLALEVTHRYSKPLHITVLDLGLTGRVAPIYPVPGDPKPFSPDHPFRLFTRKGERQRLEVPDDFPGDSGWEGVRIFATTHPLEVGWVTDGAFRSAGRGRLERLLATALGGGRFRSAPQRGDSGEEHWTVVTRRFRVRRTTP